MTDETSASSASSAAIAQTRLLLVDDDDLFRESLGLNLQDEGFKVDDFANGPAVLSFFENGGSADAVLLDWRMPGMDGIAVMRELRRRHIGLPVIFLTALSDDIYEETALDGGAVDFIDKSRRLSIVVKRIRLIVEGARAAMAEGTTAARPAVSEKGHLSLRHDTSRASWKGETAELTLTEFNIVSLLVSRSGEDVHYREIYDLVHGKDFVAGFGSEGYRANVRTFIKRIRKKFRDIDPNFDAIGNYAGFGYRWLDGDSNDGAFRADRTD